MRPLFGDPTEEKTLVPWQGDLKLWHMQGRGLEPAVPDGSTLLVHTQWRVLRRGDIVVFKAPPINLSSLWVMAIRFVPGDRLPESRQKADQPDQVPEDYYWVERERSLDSRHWGLLPVSNIRGVVLGLLHDGPSPAFESTENH